MKILVIVVTFNGRKWLERCLGSVRASEVPADLYVFPTRCFVEMNEAVLPFAISHLYIPFSSAKIPERTKYSE
jgi:hypothetical protein